MAIGDDSQSNLLFCSEKRMENEMPFYFFVRAAGAGTPILVLLFVSRTAQVHVLHRL